MRFSATEEFEILHGLRIKGMTQPEEIVESTGLDLALVGEVLQDAVERERARHRTGGRVQGYMLTGTGRERHTELRASQLPSEQEEMVAAYEAFLGPNQDFKTLTTRWQTEAGGDPTVVLTDLVALDAALDRVLDQAATAVPRMSLYRPRFTRALEAFRSGDASALAQPMSGSYHDIWMELHEDLLQVLGRERTDADG